MTPPSHRQAARFSSFFFRLFFFLDLLKHVHLHFKHVKEMASVSAAVTVFGRQAGDVCLCDTDTSPQIPPCSMCYKVPEHKWGRRGKDRSKPCRVFFFFKLRQIMFGIIVKICLTMLDEKFMSS